MDAWRWPHFSIAELRCKHTGRCEMDPEFMDLLEQIRVAYGKPMPITSGYRDPSHPVERDKETSGAHTQGRAVDVAVSGGDALQLIRVALGLGITGVGVLQKGASRFIHLDNLPAADKQPRPWIWSY